MQLVSINSGVLQVLYKPTEEDVCLGSFFKIFSHNNSGFIGQVFQINSSKQDKSYNLAAVKILFSVDESGKWLKWTGKVPSKDFSVKQVAIDELLSRFTSNNEQESINLGIISGSNQTRLNLDKNHFNAKTVIYSDKQDERLNITLLLAAEFVKTGLKTIVVDFNGDYAEQDFVAKIYAGKDFKLPLNAETIDSIYQKGLTEASAESRAVIEDVFFNVKEFIKTSKEGFLPFNKFKTVVEAEYKQSSITELVLLKNKLVEYNSQGIFADKYPEIVSLINVIEKNEFVIVDLSGIPSEWHKVYLDFIITLLVEKYQKPLKILFNADDENLDTKLLNKLYSQKASKNLSSVISTGYASKISDILVQTAQNLILFAPQFNINKFPAFSGFLNMLNASDALLYGRITRGLPVIVELDNVLSPQENQEYEEYSSAGLINTEESLTPKEEEFDPNPEVYSQQQDFEYSEPVEEDIFDEEQSSEDDFLDLEEDQDNDLYEYIDEDETDDSFEDSDTEDYSEHNDDIEEYYDYDEPEVANYSDDENFDFSDDDVELSDEDLDNISEYQNFEDSDEEDEDLRQEISHEVESLFTAPKNDQTYSEPVEAASQEAGLNQPDHSNSDEPQFPVNDIPVFSANVGGEMHSKGFDFEEGDMVKHQKYGTGIIKKIIGYGNKKLCSIQFDSVGRRLLDPELAVIEKI